jgi:hypothetical protein
MFEKREVEGTSGLSLLFRLLVVGIDSVLLKTCALTLGA